MVQSAPAVSVVGKGRQVPPGHGKWRSRRYALMSRSPVPVLLHSDGRARAFTNLSIGKVNAGRTDTDLNVATIHYNVGHIGTGNRS